MSGSWAQFLPPHVKKTLDDIEQLSYADSEAALEKISSLINNYINLFYPLSDIESQNKIRFAMLDAVTTLRNEIRLRGGLSKMGEGFVHRLIEKLRRFGCTW